MTEAKAKSSPSEEEPTFSHEQLLASPETLGVSAPTLAAALSYVTKQNVTLDEARKAVSDFGVEVEEA